MKSILDPDFKYTPSFETDIRKTFARLAELQEDKADELEELADGPPNMWGTTP